MISPYLNKIEDNIFENMKKINIEKDNFLRFDMKYEVSDYKILLDNVDLDYTCLLLGNRFTINSNCFQSFINFDKIFPENFINGYFKEEINFNINHKGNNFTKIFYISQKYSNSSDTDYNNKNKTEPNSTETNKTNSDSKNETNIEQKEIDKIINNITIPNNPIERNITEINEYKGKEIEIQLEYLNNKTIELNNIKKKSITPSSSIDEIKQTISINELISITNCTEENCKDTVKKVKNSIVETLSDTLNCKNLFNIIFKGSDPSQNIIISALSLFHTASNNLLSNENTETIVELNNCLIKSSPEFIEKINQNYKKEEYTKENLIKIISQTSSNLISISKLKEIEYYKIEKNQTDNSEKNQSKFKDKENFNEYQNASLIITKDNISLKRMIEENSVTLMKLSLEEKKLNNQDNEVFLDTNNFVLKSIKSKKTNIS